MITINNAFLIALNIYLSVAVSEVMLINITKFDMMCKPIATRATSLASGLAGVV